LRTLLRLADADDRPGVDYDYVERLWPAGEVDRCVATGLLRPGPPAQRLPCPECGELEQVIFIESRATGELLAYLPCGEGGPVPIPGERLKTWQMSFPQFLDAAFAGVRLTGGREELVRDRVWRLGKSAWAGAGWNVYFARGLHYGDARRLPDEEAREGVTAMFVPLHAVLTWKGTELQFDHEFVAAQLRPSLEGATSARRPRPKRADRTAMIELLTKHMMEHVKAARDYAQSSADFHGEPRLLPRPQQQELARLAGVSKAAVSRCFRDPGARELRYLWELADDLDRLLNAGTGPAS
jgi:predicted RNA-binding Zn-ribbon protein involved in translation (DUF1610 family)